MIHEVSSFAEDEVKPNVIRTYVKNVRIPTFLIRDDSCSETSQPGDVPILELAGDVSLGVWVLWGIGILRCVVVFM